MTTFTNLYPQAVAAAKKAKRELTAEEKALVARVVSAANVLVQVTVCITTNQSYHSSATSEALLMNRLQLSTIG